jgi:hypothetical protein
MRLTPHGFSIAGDDLMYKPEIGDPVEAARSRNAKYLLLVTVNEMSSVEESKSRAPSAKASGPAGVEESEGSEHEGPGGSSSSGRRSGTPVSARVDVVGRLVVVGDGSQVWEASLAEQGECRDVLPVHKEILYTDTCLGSLVDQVAGEIAQACAKSAGAEPAKPKPSEAAGS